MDAPPRMIGYHFEVGLERIGAEQVLESAIKAGHRDSLARAQNFKLL